MTPEKRKRVGDWTRGRKDSIETLERKRIAATGRKHSDETKEKLRQMANDGIICKPASVETKAKLSLAWKNRVVSEETKLKMSKSLTGRPCKEETKRKIGEKQIGILNHAAIKIKVEMLDKDTMEVLRIFENGIDAMNYIKKISNPKGKSLLYLFSM